MATRRTPSPIGTKSAPIASAAAASVAAGNLNFGDPAQLRARMKPMRFQQASQLIGATMRTSAVNAVSLAHAMLTPTTARPTNDEVEACEKAGDDLVAWASGAQKAERAVVVQAFGRASRKSDMISEIGKLPKAQARAFLRDYLDVDGDLGAVAEWLSDTGAMLRSAHGPGAPVDGLRSLFKAAVGVVSSAVSTVIDGIETAGKSIGDILASAVHWTEDRIAHLVTSLIEAGKKAGEILAAAASHGIELVRGAVEGLLAAGTALTEIVAWALSQSFAIAAAAIDTALRLGRTVAAVMSAALKLAAASWKVAVHAILAAGRKAAEILAAVANCAADVIRTVLEGIFATGIQLVEVVAAVCKNVSEQFRKGFIAGLVALGKGVADIFKAALESGLAIAALAFAAILEFLGGHRGLMPNELAAARQVFGWSIDLDRIKIANKSYAADFLQWVNGGRAFTTMYVLNFSSKNDFKADGELKDLAVLVHELTHVWQAVQSGPIYMIEALEQQIRHGSGAYNYTDAELTANGGNLLAFGREAQAQIIQDYYASRYVDKRSETEWTKYVPYAQKVWKARPATTTGIFRVPSRIPAAVALKARTIGG